ncbi:polar amino acid transport system substrate-binding protein [Pseudomonas citronellolis]|uniref:Polar amino acid transport system substrate-binding protein n=1 Tax=Pseudomonas citronellolis TaxID=53408 RepID=A0AAQ1KEZ2_9PSED|nr:ABC transporter substrate-binding protein [Pseudomonas citronellolis]MCP1643242.1 polar amino acid transport system substrate-binding protein [Pseudomonas citronellolis]MCP1666168.1 polar amino acid transport system substrate-binding protein [Pseudomonas citronellolis]MCP1698101.1 polar amino acid transport system substrate-binding protein [Pseudomonas citronellolis]MCP1703915.1 polar amino acid transport system substrate-binding protein [Pseudomonas citronellolis]MCP1797735.1 polar amino a
MKTTRTLLAAGALGAALLGTVHGACAAVTATPGQLKIGMEITYPPFESYDGDKVVGSDPELAAALARHMDLEPSYLNTKFSGLILGLNAGHFDAVISGMYITPERTAQAMAIPYAQTGAAIMVPAGSELKPEKPEDLCGLKVGLEQGTTWVAKFAELSKSYCEPNGKGAITVSEYPSAPEVTQALLSRHVQAQVEISGAAHMIAERSKGRVVVTSKELIYKQTLGMYVKKGNQALYDALKVAFQKTRDSGEFAAILQKYALEEAAAE